jgi:hypothetical protein
LGSNDCKDEGKVHPQRLSNHSVQEDAEPKIEADDIKRMHGGILLTENQGRSSGE